MFFFLFFFSNIINFSQVLIMIEWKTSNLLRISKIMWFYCAFNRWSLEAFQEVHETLFLQKKGGWLSKLSTLSRLFELREELQIFLTNKENKDVHDQFCKPELKLCLFDRFCCPNKLIETSTARNEQYIIFAYKDTIVKIELWIIKNKLF